MRHFYVKVVILLDIYCLDVSKYNNCSLIYNVNKLMLIDHDEHFISFLMSDF